MHRKLLGGEISAVASGKVVLVGKNPTLERNADSEAFGRFSPLKKTFQTNFRPFSAICLPQAPYIVPPLLLPLICLEFSSLGKNVIAGISQKLQETRFGLCVLGVQFWRSVYPKIRPQYERCDVSNCRDSLKFRCWSFPVFFFKWPNMVIITDL